jgi:hypothetical protein
MYRDLYDKHKHRTAFISEEYDYLYFAFEFRGTALPFNKEELIDLTEEFCDGELRVYLENNRKLVLQVKLKEENLTLLYRTVMVLAYIVGKNVTLQYYYKNFPYYTTDHDFNLHASSPISKNLLRRLLEKPADTVSTLIDLLTDESSYFNKLAVGMMQMNAFSYPESIFVYEFGLLQGLAKNNKVSGNLFNKTNSSTELKQLEEFSLEATSLLESKYPEIAEILKKKIDPITLNSRGVTKDQIRLFLQQFESVWIREHEKHIDAWNTLRSKTTTAHGGSVDITDQTFTGAARELHNLLLQIMADEVSEKFKNG